MPRSAFAIVFAILLALPAAGCDAELRPAGLAVDDVNAGKVARDEQEFVSRTAYQDYIVTYNEYLIRLLNQDAGPPE